MGPDKRYYVVVNENGKAIDYEDAITGYKETWKFNTEVDAWAKILDMVEDEEATLGEYHVESWKW